MASDGAASARSRFTPPSPADLAVHFPPFEVLDLIGQGGMGAVYRVRQRHLDRIVALKVLPPDLAADAAFAERFQREGRALARLNHPHLVSVHDFGVSGPWCWLLMEYVEGANLRQVLATGRLSPDQALTLVPQLCEALQYAHDEGVVHRDIKPENILIDGRGRVKIADFGLAKLTAPGDGPPLTASADVMGTYHYMAPEQVERVKDVDHRADLYALGVVFYEMLTGSLPLGRFAPPSHNSAVDQRIDEVVLKSLEKDRERRYQQADEMRGDVERVMAGGAAPSAAAMRSTQPKAEWVVLPAMAIVTAIHGLFTVVAGGPSSRLGSTLWTLVIPAGFFMPFAAWAVARHARSGSMSLPSSLIILRTIAIADALAWIMTGTFEGGAIGGALGFYVIWRISAEKRGWDPTSVRGMEIPPPTNAGGSAPKPQPARSAAAEFIDGTFSMLRLSLMICAAATVGGAIVMGVWYPQTLERMRQKIEREMGIAPRIPAVGMWEDFNDDAKGAAREMHQAAMRIAAGKIWFAADSVPGDHLHSLLENSEKLGQIGSIPVPAKDCTAAAVLKLVGDAEVHWMGLSAVIERSDSPDARIRAELSTVAAALRCLRGWPERLGAIDDQRLHAILSHLKAERNERVLHDLLRTSWFRKEQMRWIIDAARVTGLDAAALMERVPLRLTDGDGQVSASSMPTPGDPFAAPLPVSVPFEVERPE